jgi:hypothetical protein
VWRKNGQHGDSLVTPDDRHRDRNIALLSNRAALYAELSHLLVLPSHLPADDRVATQECDRCLRAGGKRTVVDHARNQQWRSEEVVTDHISAATAGWRMGASNG